MQGVLVSDAVAAFLRSAVESVSASTLTLYETYLGRFKESLGDRRLADLSPADVLSVATTLHARAAVQRMCRWAWLEARMIDRNPIEGMRRGRYGVRRRVLSRFELVKLMRSSCSAFRLFILAMSQTIARPREIREARLGDIRCNGSPAWSTLDLAGGRCYFHLVNFKAKERRTDQGVIRIIPIPRRLGRAIARRLDAVDSPASTVFRNSDRRPWTCNAVRCQFRRLRQRAGVVADVDGENAVAYSLRHTAATAAVVAGVRSMTLAELMGHSDVKMTRRYVHLRPDHLIAAAQSIEEFKTPERRKNERLRSLRKRPDDPK